ncbi:hypothetical protein HanXRQr2_Chr05g0206141 [Helianthus annuus]|uniref:Uncharacterized protein n=1 Tax=Helianthus annuus TaxID=4232 RepID=A0A9K3IYR5_HELAN|nr:hypothetical protein HanXRQr2_Chr05g0206141 [Helianthus annuus]KAJ0922056.1 hypothetical protein HanPSC8_Chr05g0199021 [Helianthus annuus]
MSHLYVVWCGYGGRSVERVWCNLVWHHGSSHRALFPWVVTNVLVGSSDCIIVQAVKCKFVQPSSLLFADVAFPLELGAVTRANSHPEVPFTEVVTVEVGWSTSTVKAVKNKVEHMVSTPSIVEKFLLKSGIHLPQGPMNNN